MLGGVDLEKTISSHLFHFDEFEVSTGYTEEDITLNEKILSQCLWNQITTTYTLNILSFYVNYTSTKLKLKKKKQMKYIFKMKTSKSRQI